MKKLIAVLLAAVLVLSLCACGKTGGDIRSMSAADAVKTASEKMESCKNYRENGTMKISMGASGMTIDLNLIQDAEISTDPAVVHMNMTMDMGMLGSQQIELYTVEENGKTVAYANAGDGWEKSAEEEAANSVMSIDSDAAADYEKIGEEEINGEKCIHYVGKVSSDKLPEMLGSSGDILGSLGIDVNDEEAMSKLGDLELNVWVSVDTQYPVRYQIDMTSLMEGLMSASSETAGLGISITACEFVMDFSDFDKVGTITVPADVLAAAD